MNKAKLDDLFGRLRAACAKEPTPDQIDVLYESILDNRLNDEEIIRAYKASRDSPEPWWPKPGEFLSRARPKPSEALVSQEAETIFENIMNRRELYGTYNPHSGIVLDRKRIEARHGEAAGRAFSVVASRFRELMVEDVPFVRKDFHEAYVDFRRDFGPPLTLALPGERKTLPEASRALTEENK